MEKYSKSHVPNHQTDNKTNNNEMIKYDQSWRYHENITGDMQPVEWGHQFYFGAMGLPF